MSHCVLYNPDNIFKRFKVIEFPVSFVGLSTERFLNVETNLARDAYLKTTCNGVLMKFDEAREKSSRHRAFQISQVNDTTIKITFNPINECISNTRNTQVHNNKFIFDLRLIQVSGARCCNNEFHSEIGRYYICGQYEFSKLSHYPKIINFGDVHMNTDIIKHVRIKNESTVNATKVDSVKVTGFDVHPSKFVIPPNSSKRLKVVIKPSSLKMKNTLFFEVRNTHSMQDDIFDTYDQKLDDNNLLSYTIPCKINVIYKIKKPNIVVESMHKLNEPDIRYTYVDEKTINEQMKRKKEALKHLEMCKANYAQRQKIERFSASKDICHFDTKRPIQHPKLFCKSFVDRINTYALLDVVFLPYSLDFGRIALLSYGHQELIMKNNSKYDVSIQFLKHDYILYTEEKLTSMSIKLNSFAETKVTLLCLGYISGYFQGTFEYLIDNRFRKTQKYSLQVGNPGLRIQDNIIKFGMITSESFVTSVPIRIYNDFNIPVNYRWEELNVDIPFDIIPSSGIIPEHSYRICDVIYISKLTKTKIHEINLISESTTTRVIPTELNVITRKTTVKFLQQAVIFKDIALNIKTIERVKLENSSREIATFFVVEPLIPGLTVEPMSGDIRPKMVIVFEIILKISCVIEFSFDIVVRINNKENIVLPISGNVVEPKLTIHPKNIFLSRIPCGMVTYVPVTFQNYGSVRTVIEVLDTGDENIFDVYTIGPGNEKQRLLEFFVDSGQSKTVFIKVLDIFRREYDMYIPFKINGLLGPPNENPCSLELHHYIGDFESQYENNIRVKIRNLNRDIIYCRVTGVITVPWIQFSVDKFEIDYVPNGKNQIDFTMKNVSKYYLYVTIVTSKLSPIFSLDVAARGEESVNPSINENNMKFELCHGAEIAFTLKFHPKMHGRYVSTALLFLDKHMAIPYYNLTFVGKRLNPVMTPSSYRILFPPCIVGTSMTRSVTITMGFEANLDQFSCFSKDEPNLFVKFLKCEVLNSDDESTLLTLHIKVCCNTKYSRHLILTINHECGSGCEIEITFCFTECILTLHTHSLVSPDNDPYPYYPLSDQTELYDYMENCTQFLEKWMFQQGFRRDLYPKIPHTFLAISTFLSSQYNLGAKSKGINVTYLNFMRRIAGPMIKYIHKANAHGVDESFRCVKEIHDTYEEIIYLLKSRGSDLWNLQPKFLLSYDQFVIYSEYVTPRCNADILLTRELLQDVDLFNRLSKRSWIDFILQSYKAFVFDSCFFDCVCINHEYRNVVRVLLDWFNAQIILQHKKLGKGVPGKLIRNITTDLTDGIALASALLTYCPFLSQQFVMFSDFKNEDRQAGIVNNACLIIEAMNLLRLYFPLSSTDFLNPNFLQMLFLSIHLYVVLPMFKTRDIIKFSPPLLRSSTRHVGVYPATQEALTFNFVLLNNNRNNFSAEKISSSENGKKIFLSVKFTANFVDDEHCVLLVHGYNKTRIFDTYMIFLLEGGVGVLNPIKKCKVTGPLYRLNKVDVPVSSPFLTATNFKVHVTDDEPLLPVKFGSDMKPKFYVRRLNLIDKEITLAPMPKDQDSGVEHKVYLQLMCLSTTVGNSWIWFRSEIGEFFIRVTTQPRWDIAIDTLQGKFETWPVDPCSCGEACECYRTTILSIPHRNDLMIKALRYSLQEHASEIMMQIFEQLVETTTGRIILSMLMSEGGTNMHDVKHILSNEIRYRISSKALLPRLDRVVLAHHTAAVLPLPVTLSANEKSEKFSITFTSECGMEIRTYRVIFIQSNCNMLSC